MVALIERNAVKLTSQEQLFDDFWLNRGFYRSLSTEGKHEAYRMLGHICLGHSIETEPDLFNSYPKQLQNTILSRALPINRKMYSALLQPYFHNSRLSTFAGKKTIQPLGVFVDSSYYLYRAHLSLLEKNLKKSIAWLNQHFRFHLSSQYTINEFFNPPIGYENIIKPIGPLISVVFCAKNEENYLRRALNSLLNQTWCNIEIIFIDDGSIDNTTAIFNQYRDSFSSYQYFKTTGLGVWQAKNLGLQHASGEFITFHDADDWSHPQKLELHVKPLIKMPQLIATTSLNVRIAEDNEGICTKNAKYLQRLNPSSLMFRRNFLSQIGYFFDDLLAADIEYINRIDILFGRRSRKMIKLPLMIGTARTDGLSNLHHGVSGKRIIDWENWNLLHLHYPEIIKASLPNGCRFSDYLSQYQMCSPLPFYKE